MIGSPADWLDRAAIDGVNRCLQGRRGRTGIGRHNARREGPCPRDASYDGNIDADGNPKVDSKPSYKKIWSRS